MSSAGNPEAPELTSNAAALVRPDVTELSGGSASPIALAKLEAAMIELRMLKVEPLLHRSLEALKVNDGVEGGKWALEALHVDEKCGFAWRLLGIAREQEGDYGNAIQSYEAALALSPHDVEISNDIGRLAFALDMKEQAVKLFQHFVQVRPDMPDGPNNLATVLRDLNRYEEAIDVLKSALMQFPENALLWNTLASVLSEMGDGPTALTFLDEALRLDPGFAKARYNRGLVNFGLHDYEAALTDYDAALEMSPSRPEIAMMRMARSSTLLCMGRHREGWSNYEARLDPYFAGVNHFTVNFPRMEADQDLRGKTLLVMGEQGLGDEVLFANTLPDVSADLGENGRMIIAIEPRLVSLFQRSFPHATVGPQGTYRYNAYVLKAAPFVDQMSAEDRSIDVWTPLASLIGRYRPSEASYPDRPRFLTPSPERVAHWRSALAAVSDRPKVGLLWKSMLMDGSRQKYFSPFEQWQPVLETPGVTLVNLQYGDCSEELALARDRYGVEIWDPPGIDLKQDLDELAALCCAMDRIIGFSNASTNIAAACGAPVWMISPRNSWTRVGAAHHPFYPQVRVFDAPQDRDWQTLMSHLANELANAF